MNKVFLCYTKDRLTESEKDFLQQNLSIDEVGKANNLTDAIARRSYMQSHAFKRRILSQVLRSDPLQIDFYTNLFGKPFLVKKGEQPDLFFNLSHTENLTVFIISSNHYTGIDVEKMTQKKDLEPLHKVLFHPEEMKEYLSPKDEESRRKFLFRTWTIKECFLKALGIGFSIEGNQLRIKQSNEKQYKITFPDMPMSKNITLQHDFIDDFSLAFTTNEKFTEIQIFKFDQNFLLIE